MKNTNKKIAVEKIAELAYEQNVVIERMLENYSRPSWKEASEEARSSAINHVQFLVDNPNSAPEDAHNSWLARKTAEGWVWGNTLDLEAKTDPGLVQYSERSVAHNAKAYLFRRIVETLSEHI